MTGHFAMALDLSRVKNRGVLKARREPHWQRLRPGCFVGYRLSPRGGTGGWIARAYDEGIRGYRSRALTDVTKLSPNEQFTAAKIEAEQFAHLVETGGAGRPDIQTVADACRVFAEGRPDAESRFRR